jgi:hypothetical protein
VQECAGGPQVSSHTFDGSSPASSGVAPGSARGRVTLASKSHFQSSSGTEWHAESAIAIASAAPALMVRMYPMKAGIWNLGFGLLAIGLGYSGKFVLPFTTNPMYLVGAGVVIAVLGVVQIARARSQ